MRVSAFPGITQVNVELEEGFQKRDNGNDILLFETNRERERERERERLKLYFFQGIKINGQASY